MNTSQALKLKTLMYFVFMKLFLMDWCLSGQSLPKAQGMFLRLRSRLWRMKTWASSSSSFLQRWSSSSSSSSSAVSSFTADSQVKTNILVSPLQRTLVYIMCYFKDVNLNVLSFKEMKKEDPFLEGSSSEKVPMYVKPVSKTLYYWAFMSELINSVTGPCLKRMFRLFLSWKWMNWTTGWKKTVKPSCVVV